MSNGNGSEGNGADRMAWWREAKFGMMVHFGVYAQRGFEASAPLAFPHLYRLVGDHWRISENEYKALADTFNPEQFDPREWVELMKAAGQKYIVFTTKHGDGFCMWDSAFTKHKITNTPYGKDFFRLLTDACRAEGIRVGAYYAPADFDHPGYRDTSRPPSEGRGDPTHPRWMLYLNYMECQLRELLTRYGKIDVLWWDGHPRDYDPVRFHRIARDLQPDIIINDRLGGYHASDQPDEVRGDFVTPEGHVFNAIPTKDCPYLDNEAFNIHQKIVRTAVESGVEPDKLNDWPGMAEANERVMATMNEFLAGGNPERRVPAPEEFRLWETCTPIGVQQWSYGPNQPYKSSGDLIRTLVDIASKGGNLLLNLAITPEGTPAPEQADRLRDMGKWMKVNGEAIYGTTYGPLQDLPFGRTTAKGDTVYLHVFDWPTDGKLELKGDLQRVSGVRLLADGTPASFTQERDVLTIDVPEKAPTRYASVIAIEKNG